MFQAERKAEILLRLGRLGPEARPVGADERSTDGAPICPSRQQQGGRRRGSWAVASVAAIVEKMDRMLKERREDLADVCARGGVRRRPKVC